MTVPDVGDILMASQTAWRIERAFSAGRKDAPADFQDIEVEMGSLARALTLLAEALHANAGSDALQAAGETIQNTVCMVVWSCQQTIGDLDRLMDQYQVIKKHRTVGGFAIERTWSNVILTEYKTMLWTRKGGNLQNLKELLRLHASSIALTTQAIQRKSLDQLQGVIDLRTDKMSSLNQSPRCTPERLGDIQDLVQNLAIIEPIMQAPPVPPKNPARPSIVEARNPLGMLITPASSSRASYPSQKRVSEFSFGVASVRYSSSSYASSDVGLNAAGWPSPSTTKDTFDSHHIPISSKRLTPLPRTAEVQEPGQPIEDKPLPILPPPALGLSPPNELERHVWNGSRSRPSVYPSRRVDIMQFHRNSITTSQKTAFEKEAFQNSAILCDVRGKLVEYSQQVHEEDRNDVEMVTASEECRIAVVRKRITDPETKRVHVATSVWTLSDDGAVRMELRMAEDQMYIPYSSYFSLSKVSITVPCELKFHGVNFGDRPVKIAKSSWVNYVFASPDAAALFQNEVMGRTLLATFRTEKTMRIHAGIGATFNYAQQMCALENLRVWEDNDSGAVIALIHFSASFRSGYLAFYMNSSMHPIKVKDVGGRQVKIKGLRVPIDKGDKALRKDGFVASRDDGDARGRVTDKEDEGKMISGARIKFRTEAEKSEFLDMCREVQKGLIELPDLMGVN